MNKSSMVMWMLRETLFSELAQWTLEFKIGE